MNLNPPISTAIRNGLKVSIPIRDLMNLNLPCTRYGARRTCFNPY